MASVPKIAFEIRDLENPDMLARPSPHGDHEHNPNKAVPVRLTVIT
jgi:hypothetical protein